MRARLLHGKLLLTNKIPTITYYNDKEEIDYELYIGKHWTEIVAKYKSDYEGVISNEVLVIVETNNPKVAINIAKRLIDLQWGDDILYTEFKGGKIHRFIRLSFPPWFLDHYNPRDYSNFETLAQKAQVLYYENTEDYINLCEQLDYLTCYDYTVLPTIKKIIEFSKYIGDDLLTFTINYKIQKTIEREFDPEIINVLKSLKRW